MKSITKIVQQANRTYGLNLTEAQVGGAVSRLRTAGFDAEVEGSQVGDILDFVLQGQGSVGSLYERLKGDQQKVDAATVNCPLCKKVM
jgi:hypothetical protein